MTDEEILQAISDSLSGYSYILDREDKKGRSTYIQTVWIDIKYKLKNDKK